MRKVGKDPGGPLFKWFGSKWQASKHYPRVEFDTIFEPFAGSASFSLRNWQKKVHIYESNPQLIELWNWLILVAEYHDIMSIPINLPEETDIRTLDIDRGAQLLMKMWQRTNNYGNCWTISPWGNKPGQWTESTRARVARDIEFVKDWKFSPVSYEEEGTYFIDPPYLYNYRYGYNDFSYTELVGNVEKIPKTNSQVICCEAICPKTGKVPNYLEFEFFKETVTSRRKEENNHHSKELLFHRIFKNNEEDFENMDD